MLFQNVSMGFSVDIRHMNTEKLDMDVWKYAMDKMIELEDGAIMNPTENRQVGHYWLRNPELAPAEFRREIEDSWTQMETVYAKIQNETSVSYTNLLMVGIGGSALGPQLLVDALSSHGMSVYFLDNTDPAGMDRVLQNINLAETIVVVLSKSGSTKETRNAMLETQAYFQRAGLSFAKQAIAVTVTGSALYKQAVAENWLGTLPLWDWVGGRTSITGMVGLFPLVCMKKDWKAFLGGASDMDQWTRTLGENNPALQIANAWYQSGNGRGDKAMVILPYKDSLGLLGRYLQQLIMESIGKKHDQDGREVCQGLTVYGNKGSTDQHAFVQQLRDGRNDFFATLVAVLQDREIQMSSVEVEKNISSGDYLLGFLLGTRKALVEADRSVMTLVLDRMDEYSLGAILALYERVVGYYAFQVNINAYDQPGVEAGKKAATEMLTLRQKILLGEDVSGYDPADVWLWTEHMRVNRV